MVSKKIPIVLALALVAGVANADVFNLQYTNVDSGAFSNLFVTATAITAGQFHITNITGTRAGNAVTYFEAGGPGVFTSSDGFYLLDNVLYNPTTPVVDLYSFEIKTIDGSFNFYYTGTAYTEISNADGFANHGIRDVSLTAVPGPAALGPFALGALATLRRKRRHAASAA